MCNVNSIVLDLLWQLMMVYPHNSSFLVHLVLAVYVSVEISRIPKALMLLLL